LSKGASITSGKKLLAFVVIALVIGLAIGYGVGYYTTTLSISQAPAGAERVYTLGVTFALSGAVSSVCVQWTPVVTMAIDDLNNLTKSMGLNIVFKPYILDDASTPDGALKNVQTLYATGVRIVIGPALSSQVKAVKAFSDANKLIIIAPCSNSPAIAIPDYIFRTQPSALRESKALATYAVHEGIRSVVSFHINDEFCNVFAQYFKKYFEESGGAVLYDIAYQAGQADYGSDVASLASWVAKLRPNAVFYCGYDTDGANVLNHAADEPVLRGVRWLTVEGFYGASEILTQKIVDFARATNMIGIRPVPIANPLYDEFVEKLKKYGATPTLCSENVYDAVMIAGLAVLRTGGSSDPEVLRRAIIEVAKTYYGPGGWGLFDENGDRLQASFRLWTMAFINGTYQYIDIGYIADSNIVVEKVLG
jgi:branched-chain amino acid transport system substrate-binding protein